MAVRQRTGVDVGQPPLRRFPRLRLNLLRALGATLPRQQRSQQLRLRIRLGLRRLGPELRLRILPHRVEREAFGESNIALPRTALWPHRQTAAPTTATAPTAAPKIFAQPSLAAAKIPLSTFEGIMLGGHTPTSASTTAPNAPTSSSSAAAAS